MKNKNISFVLYKDLSLNEAKIITARHVDNDISIDKFINDSTYSSNRKGLLSLIRNEKRGTIIFSCYDVRYLRWKAIYFSLFFIYSKDALLIDSNGFNQKINLAVVIKTFFMTIISTLFQFFEFLFALFFILFFRSRKSKRNINSETTKIAYIRATEAFNLTMGGSLGHTVGIIDGFKSSGETTFFGIDRIKSLGQTDQIIVKPLKYSSYVSIFNRFLYSFILFKSIHENVSHHNFIYQRLSRDNVTGILLKKKTGIPLVVEFNSFIEWELQGGGFNFNNMLSKISNRIEKLNLLHADVIVSVSKALTDQLIEKGYKKEKIITCPNAVDSQKFDDAKYNKQHIRDKFKIKKDDVLVGFSGTFSFWHGIDVLGDAARSLGNYSNIHFIFIGEGPLLPNMMSKLKGLDNMHFVGQVEYEDMPAYLSACDILLSPHLKPKDGPFIGSPTKIFEYMSMSKVIIASNLDQISEIISPSMSLNELELKDYSNIDEANGILVMPGSSTELSQAIIITAENINELNVLGENARKKSLVSYTWNKSTDMIQKKIQDLN